MNKTPTTEQSKTICWKCKNAVPDKFGNGCSWSRNLKPVDGWVAVDSIRRGMRSFTVIECPQFERG